MNALISSAKLLAGSVLPAMLFFLVAAAGPDAWNPAGAIPAAPNPADVGIETAGLAAGAGLGAVLAAAAAGRGGGVGTGPPCDTGLTPPRAAAGLGAGAPPVAVAGFGAAPGAAAGLAAAAPPVAAGFPGCANLPGS